MVDHECLQKERMKNLERKVDKLFEEDTDQKVILTKLEMSLQQVIKSNENVESYIRESQVTFKKINENLDRLNRRSEETDDKLEQVANKVDKLSDKVEQSELKNKIVIDQRDWLNKIFRKVVLPVGGLAGTIFAIYEFLNLLGVFIK